MFAPKSSYAAVVSIAFFQRERGRRHTKRELRENNGIVTEMHLRTGAGGRCGAGTLWKIRPKTERVFASRACSTSLLASARPLDKTSFSTANEDSNTAPLLL